MKNKNGFTLVELLVTIGVMAGVLVIAITSINKISDSKKEAAYKAAEEQIITAAKEYFANNKYFLDKLALTKSGKGFVSVGTLIKFDYMNAVLSIGDKTINPCSYVQVSTNGDYSFIYDNNALINNFREILKSDTCEMKEPLPIEVLTMYYSSDIQNPSFNVEVHRMENSHDDIETKIGKYSFSKENTENYNQTTGWFNSHMLVENGIYLKIDNDSYEFVENKSGIKELTSDGVYVLEIKSKSTLDDTTYKLTVKLDRTAPLIPEIDQNYDEVGENILWTNDEEVPLLSKGNAAVITDYISHLDRVERYWNVSKLTESEANSSEYKLKDNKLGYNSNEDKFSIDNFEEDDEKEEYIVPGKYSAQGYRKGIIRACDQAGNCTFSDEYIIKLDRTAPKIEVYSYKSSDRDKIENQTATTTYNQKWYSGYVWVHAKAKDDFSKTELTYNRTKGDVGGSREETDVKTYAEPKTWAEQKDYSIAQGISIYTYKACDEAGNCTEYIDEDTKAEKIVKLDRTAPNTPTIVLKKEKYDRKNEKWLETYKTEEYKSGTWYNGDITDNYYYGIRVEYSATDDYSDVVKTSWRKNSNKKTDDTKTDNDSSITARIAEQGITTIDFNACDEAGNCISGASDEYTNAKIVKLDMGKPTCSITANGNYKKITYTSNPKSLTITTKKDEKNYNGWYTSNVNITYTNSDDISGVSGGLSTTQNGSKKSTTTTAVLKTDTNSITYYGYVKDDAGNENTCSRTIKRDATPPIISSIVNTGKGDYTNANNSPIGYSHNVNLNDSTSGVYNNYKYNHCYDDANSGQTSLQCNGYETKGTKSKTITYSSYVIRGVASGNKIFQEYGFQSGLTSGKYYHLFYIIYDKAGNSRKYRYQLYYDKDSKSETKEIGYE